MRSFIRVQGTRFMEGNRPFYFVGANLNVMHGDDARAGAGKTMAAAAEDGIRVGRIWAFGEGAADSPGWKKDHFVFRAGPDAWHLKAYEQLDRVIAEAAKFKLRLIVTLSNHWKDYGGIPMYLQWAGEKDAESYGKTDLFFKDPRYEKWFFEHVRRIVTRVNSVTGVRYSEDPTIFAWELQNELQGTPEAAGIRQRWYQRMAREIRKLDPNHLIVPGLIGYNLQTERRNWIAMNSLPEVDFCDQHIYPEEHLRSRGRKNLRLYIDDRVQLAHHVIKKPIIFGEFGFEDKGSASRRAQKHRGFLERVFFDGGNGALVWIYQPTLSWKRKYGVLVDRWRYRSLRRVIGDMAKRLETKGVASKNPRIGPEFGERPIAPTHALLKRRRQAHGHWKWHRIQEAGDGSVSKVLKIPVDEFATAWFEEAGSWDGGTLVHSYGRRTGWFEYRFRGLGFAAKKFLVRARLSSEYPSRFAPKDGFSQVIVMIDGNVAGEVRVIPDDGVGKWHEVEVLDPALLKKLRSGTHTLRFEVKEGPLAKGVAIYGRETRVNKEPVEGAVGPMELVGYW
ncbi:MAG: cellulase family glycosylhydrolase [Pseudomonadota bacterium]